MQINNICTKSMPSLVSKDISPYSFLYNALRIAGFMSNHGRPWSLIYSSIHIILMTSMGVLAVLEVLLGSDNIEKLVLALSAVAIFVQVYLKLFVMMYNESPIRGLLDRLEQYRLDIISEQQYHNEIIKADNICRKYSKYWFTLFFTFPIISFISNFITDYSTNFEAPHLTFQLYIPWNMNKLWSYMATAIFQLILTFSAATIYASCGALQFTFTFQLSAYLKILQSRLETKGSSNELIYLHHKQINQFLQEYNEIYSGQLFVEILVASLEPCGFGYTIIRGIKTKTAPAVDTYNLLILCFVGPFLMYYCGQEISTQMEKLHESTYMSYWYEENPKVRRDVYTIMLMTVRPITLNYRLFVTFDMKCGTTIVQGLYSYLMMINHFETAD